MWYFANNAHKHARTQASQQTGEQGHLCWLKWMEPYRYWRDQLSVVVGESFEHFLPPGQKSVQRAARVIRHVDLVLVGPHLQADQSHADAQSPVELLVWTETDTFSAVNKTGWGAFHAYEMLPYQPSWPLPAASLWSSPNSDHATQTATQHRNTWTKHDTLFTLVYFSED